MHASRTATRLVLRPNTTLRVSLWLALAMSSLFGTRDLRAQANPQNVSRPIPAPQITQESPTNPPVIAGTDIRFYRAATGEGLSQTRASQILQDDQGFMWFGTQYGLNRYDGYKFKVFLHDPADPTSLSGVFITALFKDRSGIIWVGCHQFLDKYDPATETFTHYRIQALHATTEQLTIQRISQDSTGLFWLATTHGLFGFNPDSGWLALIAMTRAIP